jgi:hypothetical protein
MSLDVYLEDENGTRLYSANITHNLCAMAEEAGIYMVLWRPEEIGITRAGEVIGPLTSGLHLMVEQPARFRALDPVNGWGSWEGFVPWCALYLEACRKHPDALVNVSR